MCALKFGSRGKKVKNLQEKLNNCGYDPGDCDGYFGYKTLEAVANLRQDLHLPPTGQIDRQFLWYLKNRSYFGGTYQRGPNGILVRTFKPRIGSLGFLNGADFEISLLDNERSNEKVLVLEESFFLATQLLKIRKYPFYLAFHTLSNQKKAQILTLGRKAKGLIYLPWEKSPPINQPLITPNLAEELKILLKEFSFKDLYLAIPLIAFEWVLKLEKNLAEPSRHSGKKLVSSKGELLLGYPIERPYEQTIEFLRKQGHKGRKVQGDIFFQYQKSELKTVIKILSSEEIARLLNICDDFRLSGVIFWGATLGEDRLWQLNIPKQL